MRPPATCMHRPPAAHAQVRCSRCATAAASVRPWTSSLERIRETWTQAVFSAMNSAAPIWRLVAPWATSGEHLALARRSARTDPPDRGAVAVAPSVPLARAARARRRPAAPRRSASGPRRRASATRAARPLPAPPRRRSAAAVALAGRDLALGLAPARHAPPGRGGSIDSHACRRLGPLRALPRPRARAISALAYASRACSTGPPPASTAASSRSMWIRARASASRAPGGLAQVPGALRAVGLDRDRRRRSRARSG